MSQKYTPLNSASALGTVKTRSETKEKDSFRVYDFHLKPYLDDFNSDEHLQLIAQPGASQNIDIDQFKIENYVPFQLQLEKSGLFPEFYFHFKRGFSAESIENRAYCSVDLEKFGAIYIGTEEDITHSIVRVENDFELKFRKCLHPDLLKEFSSWYFTRTCVETKFREKLRENVDLTSYSYRLNELTSRAHRYNVTPLLEFLMAYEHSESSIWHHVLVAFSSEVQTEKRIKYLNKKAAEWKNVEISLTRQIQGFVSDLEDEEHTNTDPDACLVVTFCVCLLTVLFMIIVMARN